MRILNVKNKKVLLFVLSPLESDTHFVVVALKSRLGGVIIAVASVRLQKLQALSA